MSRIFISHSSRNNAEALALQAWLDANGWGRDEVFLDLDPVRGLVAGDRWQARLKEAANRCEAVLFAISPAWAASRWCGAEFLLAKTLGKKIFGVIVEPTPLDTLPVELTGEFQLVDLSADGEAQTLEVNVPPADASQSVRFHAQGLLRLKAGLERAGLDARSFPFDPERPIFRGLRALEEKDASIFFGRDTRIVEGLDSLRSLTDKGGAQFLVILGASGSGKSSFLRAGLWPRLERDDRKFLPLPVVRPSRAALTGEHGLIASLGQSARQLDCKGLTWAAIEDRLAQPDGLTPILAELKAAARGRLHDDTAKPPLIVLPIDQGEELFEADAGREAERVLEMICPLARQAELLVLLSMRSDSFERLQHAPQLQANGVDVTVFSLPPMPPHAFKDVVEGPVVRLRAAKGEAAIEYDPRLTDRLLGDIGSGNADALPLLAFVLERQLRRYDRLTLADYEASQGLQGAIVDAAAEAFRNPKAEPAIPEAAEVRQQLLRKAFIPWLARVDEATGETRRRVASLSEIPAEAHALIERLVQVRLLVRHQPLKDGRPDLDQSIQIEAAHEALLRQWPELVDWLTEEKSNLLTLETILRSAGEWEDNHRSPDYINHKGGRLSDAVNLARRKDYQAKLRGLPETYLSAAQKAEDEQRQAERAQIEREKKQIKEIAEAQRVADQRLQQQQAAQAEAAESLKQKADAQKLAEGRLKEQQAAQAEAAESLKQKELAQRAKEQADLQRRFWWRAAVAVGLISLALVSLAMINAWSYADESDGRLVESQKAQVRFLSARADELSNRGEYEAAYSLLGKASNLVGADLEEPVYRWELLKISSNLRLLAPPMVHAGSVQAVAFSPDGSRVVTGSVDGTARLWDGRTGAPIGAPMKHEGAVRSVAFSRDSSRVVTGSDEGTAQVWDGKTGTSVGASIKHDSGIAAVAFSPDGNRVLTGSDDYTARLWGGRTGAPIGAPMKHDWGGVTSIAFSPDGTRVVTGSSYESASLWDGNTGAPIGVPMKHDFGAVHIVAFSPDGTRVVTGSSDKSARLWDGKTGAPIGAPMKHGFYVNIVAFSSDGARVVTGSGDKTARLWDGKTGAPIGAPMKHEGGVHSVAFSPDGTRVVTGSDDGTARLWDGRTGAPIGAPMKHEGAVRSVAFSPDGARVVTGSDDYTARLWDVKAGAPAGPPMKHNDTVTSVVFSRDGMSLMTGSLDATARLWSGKTGAPFGVPMNHDGRVDSVAFSPDGTRVVTGSDTNTARLWDGKTGAPIGVPMKHGGSAQKWNLITMAHTPLRVQHEHPLRYRPISVNFSPDGTRVVTGGSSDNEARLWDGKTGAPIGVPMKHEGGVHSVAFSPDGTRVMTQSDQTARLWDGQTGAPIGTQMKHDDDVNSAAFSPDGTRVVTGSSDKSARLWDGKTGAPIGAPMKHEGGVRGVAFSPDGTRVVTESNDTGSNDNAARLWDGKTGAPIGAPMKHEGGVHSVAFSPDGTLVVTGSSDKSARLWDGKTGAPIGAPMKHEGGLRGVAFSPDGTRVVTGSNDNAARLWDGKTGAPIGPPMKHEGGVHSVAFSPDGTRVVTESDDYTTRLWDVADRVIDGFPIPELVSGEILSPDDLRNLAPSHPNLLPDNTDANNDCDLLAGHPFDPELLGNGVYFEHIDNPRALEACRRMARLHPDEGRYFMQWSRTLEKADKLEDAIEKLKIAVKLSHRFSIRLLATKCADGKVVGCNDARAHEYFQTAIDQGLVDAHGFFGNHLWDHAGAGSQFRQLAVEQWQRGAAAFDADSHRSLGDRYQAGDAARFDLTQDFAKALFHWAAALQLMEYQGRDDQILRWKKAGMARYLLENGQCPAVVRVWYELEPIRNLYARPRGWFDLSWLFEANMESKIADEVKRACPPGPIEGG